ncbi:MAG: ectoine hydrolase DoeA [Actinomycetota bacterium]|nr:ectoine hydrolase DoeA [Actinomycetota bacterium]|tara:strand:- start:633 stop:1817 length:1185 start_codon:yes stop_codon:yes gene_type:complete
MPDVELDFSREEYATRLAKVRSAMESKDIDVLVSADPSNMSWLTGYDGWSFYTPQAVLVTHDDDPIWWGRGMDAKGALRTVYMDERHVIAYSDDHVMSTEKHAYQHLAALLSDSRFGQSVIGVELDNYYYSAASHIHLLAGLPQAQIVDATGLINWQRTIKSEQELIYMRRAARIVEKMHHRILELIEPGMRKNDLVAEVYHTSIAGTEEFGGDYPAIVPLMPTGVDASAAHITWDDKPFKSGEGTFFEIAGVHRRYHVPLCRSVFLGEPPQKMVDAEKALVEGLEAGLEAARPGNRACDIANALHETLARAGIERDARCGYPIGLSYPPDWGERTISLRGTDESELKPGMTFHFMPGLWMDDWGMEITESFMIAQDGPAETFADFPRKLFVKK